VNVSVVVTDVKGFSALTRQYPDAMIKAMGGHNNIMRKVSKQECSRHHQATQQAGSDAVVMLWRHCRMLTGAAITVNGSSVVQLACAFTCTHPSTSFGLPTGKHGTSRLGSLNELPVLGSCPSPLICCLALITVFRLSVLCLLPLVLRRRATCMPAACWTRRVTAGRWPSTMLTMQWPSACRWEA
jgi:hypothetical protein